MPTCPRATAGDWHWNPLRFDLAWHLNAWCISKSMGLILRFFCAPTPWAGDDVADDRLAALGHMNMLDVIFCSPCSGSRLSAAI